MKVAFLSYDFGEYCIRLTSGMAPSAQVALLLPDHLAEPYLDKLDPAIRFHPFHKPRLRQPIAQLKTVYKIIQTIKKFNPDVIHLQQGQLWLNPALFLLKRYPLIITVHDARHHIGDKGAHNTPQAVYDYGFRRADQLIVHAEQLKQQVIDELHLPAETIHVVPHILMGESTVTQPNEAQPTVLFFGRIWEYKGLEYLIRAEPLITKECPNVKIVIAGKGEDFSRYRQMMTHPEQFIVYNEYVSDEQRADLFQQANVVVLPYIEASQSGVIPIAYTAAKPVVATTVGGLPEMVDHGETGYLVPPRDEQALAQAILDLLQNTQQSHEMGLKGQQKILAECSPAIVAEQTLEVYQHALRHDQ